MDLGQYNNFIQAFQKAVDDIRADIANGFARLEGKLAQPTGLSQDLKNRAGGRHSARPRRVADHERQGRGPSADAHDGRN